MNEKIKSYMISFETLQKEHEEYMKKTDKEKTEELDAWVEVILKNT